MAKMRRISENLEYQVTYRSFISAVVDYIKHDTLLQRDTDTLYVVLGAVAVISMIAMCFGLYYCSKSVLCLIWTSKPPRK